MKKWLAVLLMFTFVFILMACGGKAPTSITISSADGKTEVAIGKTLQLTAAVLPEGADQSVTWSSSNENVATVSSTGLVTAGSLPEETVIIKATSTVDQTVTGTYTLKVGDDVSVYPDLKEYTIVIMNADTSLGSDDPFLSSYTSSDKEARQKAWDVVRKRYNCKLSVEAYPGEAPWGPGRQSWINVNAATGGAAADIFVISTYWIPNFVTNDSIVELTNFYNKYGQGAMDPANYVASQYKGKLYGMIDGGVGIEKAMFYNVELLESLGMEKTPAQIFNDGDWTYSKFADYAIEVAGKLASKTEQHYSVFGQPCYYWQGMIHAAGFAGADTATLSLRTREQAAQDAAATLARIAAATNGWDKDAATAHDANEPTQSWNMGKAVFGIGSLWFVRNESRWPSEMWKADGTSKFGYVPFPRPDGTAKESQRVGYSGGSTYALANGRTSPSYVTYETVYRVWNDTFLLTRQYAQADPLYDREAIRKASAKNRTDTEDSVEALLYMSDPAKFMFDPLEGGVTNFYTSGSYSSAIRSIVWSNANYSETLDAIETAILANFREIFG